MTDQARYVHVHHTANNSRVVSAEADLVCGWESGRDVWRIIANSRGAAYVLVIDCKQNRRQASQGGEQAEQLKQFAQV